MHTTSQTATQTTSSTTSDKSESNGKDTLTHPVLRYHFKQLAHYVNAPDFAPPPAVEIRDTRIAIMAALYHLDRVAEETRALAALILPVLRPPKM